MYPSFPHLQDNREETSCPCPDANQVTVRMGCSRDPISGWDFKPAWDTGTTLPFPALLHVLADLEQASADLTEQCHGSRTRIQSGATQPAELLPSFSPFLVLVTTIKAQRVPSLPAKASTRIKSGFPTVILSWTLLWLV